MDVGLATRGDDLLERFAGLIEDDQESSPCLLRAAHLSCGSFEEANDLTGSGEVTVPRAVGGIDEFLYQQRPVAVTPERVRGIDECIEEDGLERAPLTGCQYGA